VGTDVLHFTLFVRDFFLSFPTTQRVYKTPLPGKSSPFTPVARHTGSPHLSFGKLEPTKGHNGPTTDPHSAQVITPNKFTPLREHANSSGRDNEALSLGIHKKMTSPTASGSRSSRDRDPISITPDILYLWKKR
jgi:hypothetical protein